MSARPNLPYLAVPALVLLHAVPGWAEPASAPPATASAPAAPASAEASAPAATAAPAQPPAQGEATAAPEAAPPAPASPSAMTVAESPYGNGTHVALAAANPNPPPQRVDQGPDTLLDASVDYAIGGMGGISVLYTRFAHLNAVAVCGEGAIIIDHALTLGGGGCGIAREINAEQYGTSPHDPNDRMQFGFGGAIARYHFFSRRVVNLGVGALLGAGGIEIGTWDGSGQNWDTDFTHKRTDAVFVFEPQIGGYANITRWLRAGALASYRIVGGVNIKGLSNGSVGGPMIGGQVQAGWF